MKYSTVESIGQTLKRHLNLIKVLGYEGHFKPEVPLG